MKVKVTLLTMMTGATRRSHEGRDTPSPDWSSPPPVGPVGPCVIAMKVSLERVRCAKGRGPFTGPTRLADGLGRESAPVLVDLRPWTDPSRPAGSPARAPGGAQLGCTGSNSGLPGMLRQDALELRGAGRDWLCNAISLCGGGSVPRK